MLAFVASFVLIQTALCKSSLIRERREFDLEDVDVIDRRKIGGDTLLSMRIGLRHNENALANAEDWLIAVADPDSPKFGQHWTQTEVVDACKPSDDSVKAISEWLSSHGITWFTHSNNKMWLAFDLPASVAEALLETEYFEHRTNRGTFEVSCDEYSLPEDLKDHIDYITPGVKSKYITFRFKRSHPTLYKHPAALNDIFICNNSDRCPIGDFQAVS